ncbi:porin family protein [Proteiniphilum sp. UBA1028]|jgi:opacity protein-like surface antigen|uniref:porin family protein n=1 Tax=Proteiniphilum sp. UBA1028 TaxID=1947251 RepID=UPI000E9980FE|nr:porin family protein [Proteiniphilum sp. UBA1028]HBG57673.1 PorT family protein [Porphyromonadaceae bacterium]
MRKKTILVSLIALVAIGITSVNAQTPVYWGVKGELNMSNFLLSDFDQLSTKMKVGPNLGGFMRIEMHENFALQPELSFFYRNAKIEMGPKDDIFKQWGVQLPIYALGQYKAYNGLFYGGIGPFVGLGFDASLDDLDIDLYKEIAGKTAMKRWDFGLGLLLGYEFNNGFQVNAGYQVGLINQSDELVGLKDAISGSDDAKMRTQTVHVGIGFRF